MKVIITDEKDFRREIFDRERFFNLFHMDVYVADSGTYKVVEKRLEDKGDFYILVKRKK